MGINPSNVAQIIINHFTASIKISEYTQEDEEFAENLKGVLQQCRDLNFECSTSCEVDFGENDEITEQITTDNNSESSDDTDDSEEVYDVETDEKRGYNAISLEKKEKIVKYWLKGKKPLAFETVKQRFRKEEFSRSDLYRFSKQTNQGNRIHLLEDIKKHVFDRFCEARMNRRSVHDADLKRWAQQRALEIKMFNFRGSDSWVLRLKQFYGLVSRKITTFSSVKSDESQDEREQQSADFVKAIKTLVANFGPDNVFNTDQSGIQKEMHAGHTLEVRGVKKVFSRAQRIAALTHSVTIQPTISMSGKFLPKALLVLQEPTGKLGPRVLDGMYRPSNLHITCSKSGKIDKTIIREYYQHCFLPDAPPKSMMLMDSCPTHKDRDFLHDVEINPDDKEVEVHIIPAGTTGYTQPLDVYGFRIWKNFVRKIEDRGQLDNEDLIFSSRNVIILVQSFVFNQLSSPRFQNCFEYGWYKAGFTDIHPPLFENPCDFCFNTISSKCFVKNCDFENLLKCLWCKNFVCFKHALNFTSPHVCEKYIP